jgi:hypothetical protein
MTEPKPKCKKCQKPYTKNVGRGRPREYCTECRPPRATK